MNEKQCAVCRRYFPFLKLDREKRPLEKTELFKLNLAFRDIYYRKYTCKCYEISEYAMVNNPYCLMNL